MVKKDIKSLEVQDGLLGQFDWKYQEVGIDISDSEQVPFTKLLETNKELYLFFYEPLIKTKVRELTYPNDVTDPIGKYLENNYSFWEKVKYFFFNFKWYNG